MLTIEKLKEYGANTDEGVTRCLGREEFYLMLVGKAIEDDRFPLLARQLAARDLAAAFETAHALKGTYTTLSLTPLAKPVVEMTELLRQRSDVDYTQLFDEAKAQFEKLCAL